MIWDVALPYGAQEAKGPFQSRPTLQVNEIETLLPALIVVENWSQQAIDDAVAELEARFNAGLDRLVSGQALTLMFKVDNTYLDE